MHFIFPVVKEERSAILSHILKGEEGCRKKSQGTLKIMIMFFVR